MDGSSMRIMQDIILLAVCVIGVRFLVLVRNRVGPYFIYYKAL